MKLPPFRKVAVYGGGILVALGLLGAAVLAFENHRGQRVWEEYRREAEARGIKFGLEDFAPPPVPDEQNFATTPLFARLFEGDKETRERYAKELDERLYLKPLKKEAPGPKESWLTGQRIDLVAWSAHLGVSDLSQALQKFEPELAEIAKAAERPGVRFPLNYSMGTMMWMPHCSPFLSLTRILRLRALTALEQGKPEQALADIELILRLGDTVTKQDAVIISSLVHVSIAFLSLQPIWEGLAAHQWSEDQLRLLQDRLQQVDLLAVARRSLERERLGCAIGLERLLKNQTLRFTELPESWSIPWPPNVKAIYCQNLILSDRLFEGYLLPMIDVEAHRVHPGKADDYSGLMAKHASPFRLYRMIADVTHASLKDGIASRFAEIQTYLDEAIIACALERHRLREGRFPDQLSALVSGYLAKLPHDVLTGEPLKYRLTDDGGYLLYAVGINGTDDNGIVAFTEDGRNDPKQGDWVWRMPPTLPATLPTAVPTDPAP